MADPWSTVPELRLNLGVYILCMVGGLVGNIMVITVMVREKTSRTFHADTWKTNLFLLSLTVSNIYKLDIYQTWKQEDLGFSCLVGRDCKPKIKDMQDEIKNYDCLHKRLTVYHTQLSNLLMVTKSVPTT